MVFAMCGVTFKARAATTKSFATVGLVGSHSDARDRSSCLSASISIHANCCSHWISVNH